ncbi:MAG: transporter [Gemmatimonadaceae bacterium]
MAAAKNEDDEEVPSGPPPVTEPGDLGFGRVVAQNVRGRFLNRDGSATSRKYGLGSQRAERFYLNALNARWPAFLGWLVGGMLLLNGCFALAYRALGPSALKGVEAMGIDDPFLRAFSFSVGLFTTNGSDAIQAVGATTHWLVVFESLIGPLCLVAAIGLIIARLTRPRMNIRFSESAVIAPYEGGRGLMFRMVNAQPGELSDVQARVTLAWFEDSDGVRKREFHNLTLERSSVEMFNLHWTVVHPINADSPLAGVTPEKLAAAEAEFLIFVSAHEETFSTHVTTRTSYFWDEVRWDVKWASVFASGPDGVLAIDVDRLDRTERLDVGATATPAVKERAEGKVAGMS